MADQMTAPARAAAHGLVVLGEWNINRGYIGLPQSGKSTLALVHAIELGKTPAYVFVHDPNMRVPDRLPDGMPVHRRRYKSVDECKRALKKDAGGVHCLCVENATEVVELATATAAASLRAHGGERGVPSIVLLDEIVMADDASPSYLAPPVRKAIAIRRGLHVGILWTVQSFKMAHPKLYQLPTEIFVFQLGSDQDVATAASIGMDVAACAATKDAMVKQLDGSVVKQKVSAWPRYKYISRSFG